MSGTKGYKCFNIKCGSCIGKTLCGEPEDTALVCVDRVIGKPMTNAQKIRAMSDEELAWELMLWRCEAVARHHGISSVYPDTQKTILEWLQMPSGEEDKHEQTD